MDFLFQAKERQEEERARKLDSLIRQQQATRRESVKNSPVLRFKKIYIAALSISNCTPYIPVDLLDLYTEKGQALQQVPVLFFFTSPDPADAARFQNECTVASTQDALYRSGRFSVLQ